MDPLLQAEQQGAVLETQSKRLSDRIVRLRGYADDGDNVHQKHRRHHQIRGPTFRGQPHAKRKQ